MKLGIIGTGMIVNEFLPILTSTEPICVNAILSTSRSLTKAQALANKFNINKATDNFEEFCKYDIDTAYIAIPNNLHVTYALKSLEAGLNIIIEKPFATCIEDAQKIKKLAARKKLLAFEAITTQYLPAYQTIKDNICKVGKIKGVDCSFCQKSSRYERFLNGELAPVFDAKYHGGALMDLNCYNIHFVVGLFGLPKRSAYKPKIINNIDVEGTAILDYGSFLAKCIGSKSKDGQRSCKITGTNGTIHTTNTASLIDDVVYADNFGKSHVLHKANKTNNPSLRARHEFQKIAQAIETQDIAFCTKKLQTTINVVKILSELSIF